MFIDESGFNLAMTLAYAYAPKGQRAVGRVPKNRGENTSLVAAISLDEGVSDAMTLTGAVDGDAFLAYIRQILAPRLRPGQIEPYWVSWRLCSHAASLGMACA